MHGYFSGTGEAALGFRFISLDYHNFVERIGLVGGAEIFTNDIAVVLS
ncbi:MAG TPA: hypothetical protein VIL09_17620 [Microvirga sp.]|jgi:hypothetical protein